MTQAQLDRRVIVFVIGAFLIMFLVIATMPQPHTKQEIRVDTLRVYQQRIDTLLLKETKLKTIYEKDIDTIYILDSVGVSREYARTLRHLDSLSKAGFFNQR